MQMPERGRYRAAASSWPAMLLLLVIGGAQGASLDVDGDDTLQPQTDGQLILRHLFGFSVPARTDGAVGSAATRDQGAIAAYLTQLSVLDVDANGSTDALTDGLLILRFLSGYRGNALTVWAVSPNCTRCASEAIETYLALRDWNPLINDTGIATCGDADASNDPCPLVDLPNQDAEYGRDITDNDDSDGHAGFSFTMSIVSNDRHGPAIDTAYFQNTVGDKIPRSRICDETSNLKEVT